MAVGKGPGPAKAPKVDLDDLVRRWEADKKSRLFLQLADEYRKQDQVDAAISVLREGLKVHATFVPAHVALARCLMAKGQPAQAQAELEPIHKKSPDNMLAGKLLAEVLAERGEGGRALTVLKSLRPFAIDDPEIEERITALEARLRTPNTRSSGSGDTAEFATGEFASSTASAGGTTGSFVRPPATAPAAAAPAAPAPPPPPAEVVTLPPASPASEEDVLGAAGDDADVIVIDEPDSGDDVIVLGDESAPLEEDLEPPPELPPMPRPDRGPEDLLGAPLAAASPAGPLDEQDEFMSMTLAELHESQGSMDRAIAIYERLLATRPGDAALRRALDRCKARLAGADVAAPVIEAVAAPPPSVARPRWEPIRARPSASTESMAPPAPDSAVASDASPVAEGQAPTRPVVATRPLPEESLPAAPSSSEPVGAPARPRPARTASGPAELRATAAELRRWLAAVAAVRQ